jgi:hypothetical protein
VNDTCGRDSRDIRSRQHFPLLASLHGKSDPRKLIYRRRLLDIEAQFRELDAALVKHSEIERSMSNPVYGGALLHLKHHGLAFDMHRLT